MTSPCGALSILFCHAIRPQRWLAIGQVNLKLFAPDPNKQRTVLLFVFRDRTKTPLPRLIQTWEEDLAQMWHSITKPAQYQGSSFTDFFEAGLQVSIGRCTFESNVIVDTLLV